MKKDLNKLEAIYKKIPQLDCQGHCYKSCTVIPAETIEVKRAREKLSFNPFLISNRNIENAKLTGHVPACGALKNKRCTIYSIRPTICRLYGAAEGLECAFGCQPKQKELTKQEAYALLREVRKL